MSADSYESTRLEVVSLNTEPRIFEEEISWIHGRFHVHKCVRCALYVASDLKVRVDQMKVSNKSEIRLRLLPIDSSLYSVPSTDTDLVVRLCAWRAWRTRLPERYYLLSINRECIYSEYTCNTRDSLENRSNGNSFSIHIPVDSCLLALVTRS